MQHTEIRWNDYQSINRIIWEKHSEWVAINSTPTTHSSQRFVCSPLNCLVSSLSSPKNVKMDMERVLREGAINGRGWFQWECISKFKQSIFANLPNVLPCANGANMRNITIVGGLYGTPGADNVHVTPLSTLHSHSHSPPHTGIQRRLGLLIWWVQMRSSLFHRYHFTSNST